MSTEFQEEGSFAETALLGVKAFALVVRVRLPDAVSFDARQAQGWTTYSNAI
jgi:hypothetical protein